MTAFVLWMLLFPLVCTIRRTLMYKAGIVEGRARAWATDVRFELVVLVVVGAALFAVAL